VQGSVLGPILFNIYTRELENKLKTVYPEVFVTAYADDSYVSFSCDPLQLNSAITTISELFDNHTMWLGDLGMVCNKSKTEVIAFGHPDPSIEVRLGDTMIKSNPSVKILGIIYDQKLSWKEHVTKIIKKCNSLSYPLRVLNNTLPRHLHRMIIHSHLISHMSYGSQIWAGTASANLIKRLSRQLNKVVRMHTFTFDRSISNAELYRKANIRTFDSLRTMQDAIFLYKLVCLPTCSSLTERLFSQITFSIRFPGRPIFLDLSRKRVGKNTFINRAKSIAETIRFDWTDLTLLQFISAIKKQIPLFV